jgi:drug/metabolite transporter (DMT)-like permease
MTRRDITLLAALSLIWGSSFMFIRVADRSFQPFALVFLRALLACVVLVPVMLARTGRRGLRQARERWGLLLALAAMNTAIPFLLFAWAETRITSSLAGILQASGPIFTVILAYVFLHERIGGIALAGVAIGALGVVLLVGAPGGGGALAALAVLLAAFGYACGAVFAAARLSDTEPLVIAAGACVFATLLAAPVGVPQLPSSVPGWKETGSILLLGLVGTGVAYLMSFALIQSAGPSRMMLVTYIIPGVAVLYGWLLLGETLRAIDLIGLAVILAGVALAARGRRATSQDPAYTSGQPQEAA